MTCTSMARRSAPVVVAIAAAVALWACAPRADQAVGTVRDSAGVSIVENASADVALPWSFETDLVLGGADEGPQAWSSLDREVMGVDAAGHVYVLDVQAKRVVVFEAGGELLRTVGAEGGGPGELRMPYRMAVSPGGEIWVLDFGKGGYVRWGPEGAPLEEVKPLLIPPAGRQHYFTVTDHGMTVSTRAQVPGADGWVYALRDVRGADTTDVVALAAPNPREVMMLECGGALMLPPLFSPEIVWAERDRTLAVTASDAYAIDLYEGGVLRRSIRRGLPAREASHDDAMQEVGEGMQVRFGANEPCVFPADRVVEQQGFAPTIPWVGAIGIDADGEVWVERRALGREARGPVDVFAPWGRYLGTLPEGTPFPAVFLPDGRIGVVETDELDVPRLLVQRIVGREDS